MSEAENLSVKPESLRRLWLRVLTKMMVVVSVVVGLWVTLSPLFRTGIPVNDRVVETIINVSDFDLDDVDIIEWFDKPLIIARRSAELEALLVAVPSQQLADPDNHRSIQPRSADNSLRSSASRWFVAIGLGTSSGCALRYESSTGHFIDGCDGSRYDLAGRALSDGPATKNMPIPNWRYENGRVVVSTKRVNAQ